METVADKALQTAPLYARDFHAWTQEQVQLLRLGQFKRLDVENLIEEIGDMGRSEAAALESAMTQALHHLIKLSYSPAPAPRGGWEVSVLKQRVAVERLLRSSPGLQSRLGDFLAYAWEDARLIGIAELAAHKEYPAVPENCPFTIANLRDKSFLPIPTQSLPRND